MSKLNWRRVACAMCVLGAAPAIASPAQTFTSLFSFNGTDGAFPAGALVQATNGYLYGTTENGGASSTCVDGCGTVFKITASGTLTTLYSFCSLSDCTDGLYPNLAALVQATNGDFYGTTSSGGGNDSCPGGCGTIFKITPSGLLTTVHSFDLTDGANPYAGLLLDTDGNFYGTTLLGGANGGGTVFKISSSGTLTTLYSFCSQSDCTDGSLPYAALVQAANGYLYGTTAWGGTSTVCGSGCGTVFKITPSGMLTTLYSFCSQSGCADGFEPTAGLVLATNGNFYGTTYLGGANGACTGESGCGTVFKITPSGTQTTLYSFCSLSNCTDGEYPLAGLIQATNGNFYGTTSGGGVNSSCSVFGAIGCGTAFAVTPSGRLTTLYSFCSESGCTDGEVPLTGLVQDTSGKFYGTTVSGGANNSCNNLEVIGCGTVFSLAVGLGPFVEARPNYGKIGVAIKILGTDLTGASSVSFNGTAATFTIVSASLINTTIPSGATTGKIQVVTPSGTLTSNANFRVTQ